MGYQVLARKYRPQRFSDVAGQDHVTRTLLNALSQNRIAHGYIFSGHRGIGKTTIARILAMALNCRTEVGSAERPTHEPCLRCMSCREICSGGGAESGELATHSFDFIEIDAASNRGIDDVRSIRQQASVQPARDKYKIFLLDEAHQITDAAFNAILKTLEEPPEWTIFMMATTEPENIPQTIRSRCQHFSFHAVKFEDILGQLRMIADKEGVEAEDAALALLAEAGDGSMRDALSIMDQAIASAPCNDAGKAILAALQIRDLMGTVPNAVFERLLEAVAAGQSAELMEQLNVLLNAGHSPSSLARQMVRYLRNALMAKLGGEQTELLQISADERARANRTALLFSEEDLTRNLQIVLRTFDELNYRQEQRFHLELGLLKLVHAQRLLPLEELLSGVASGAPVRSPAPSSTPRASAPTPPVARPSAPTATPAPASKPASPLSPFGSSPFGSPSSSASSSSSDRTSTTPTIKQSAVAEPVPEIPEPPPIQAPTPIAVAPAVTAPAVAAPIAPTPIAAAPAPAVSPMTPFPAASATPQTGFAETLTEGSLAKAPSAAPSAGTADVDTLRQAVVQALAQGGHQSASTLLGAGAWTIDGANLRIEVAGMGKKMLSLTVNAAAEKIIRQELQRLSGPARFMVVPGEGPAAGAGSGPAMAAPLAGSVQEEALNHPLVQRAKEIFNAEVRSVVDLRTK
ncbi:DNA polymerase III subunit gamma/tau [Occallatibacter riparius]|uniref:DNA polymerase III subunit gamma/tau n=1 Tax=Occallatibacter riparius TaxID=1002689 RepID=UPI0028C43A1B|nr:DNA polymerase III subunit gamma/tau [Occallatibacter riparius]